MKRKERSISFMNDIVKTLERSYCCYRKLSTIDKYIFCQDYVDLSYCDLLKATKMRCIIFVFLVYVNCVKCLELESFYQYLSTDNSSTNTECNTQLSVFLQALLEQKSWALKSKTVNESLLLIFHEHSKFKSKY